MQKMIRLIAIIIASAIMSSCGSDSNSEGPKEVVKAFSERMAKKDFDSAALYVTTSGQMAINFMKTQAKRLESAGKLNMGKIIDKVTEKFRNIEIGEEKINGDVATVMVRSKDDNREVEVPMRKEMGAWKVDFSPDKFMDKKSNDSVMDSPSQKMSREGLIKAYQKGDSLLKNMTPEEREQYEKMLEGTKK